MIPCTQNNLVYIQQFFICKLHTHTQTRFGTYRLFSPIVHKHWKVIPYLVAHKSNPTAIFKKISSSVFIKKMGSQLCEKCKKSWLWSFTSAEDMQKKVETRHCYAAKKTPKNKKTKPQSNLMKINRVSTDCKKLLVLRSHAKTPTVSQCVQTSCTTWIWNVKYKYSRRNKTGWG